MKKAKKGIIIVKKSKPKEVSWTKLFDRSRWNKLIDEVKIANSIPNIINAIKAANRALPYLKLAFFVIITSTLLHLGQVALECDELCVSLIWSLLLSINFTSYLTTRL